MRFKTFSRTSTLLLLTLFMGCSWGAPPSRTPFGDEEGEDAAYKKVANAFLMHLQDKKIDKAYSLTSDDYKSKTNFEAFTDLTKKHPFPTGAVIASYGMKSFEKTEERLFSHSQTQEKGSISLEIKVSKLGEKYHVTDFRFLDE